MKLRILCNAAALAAAIAAITATPAHAALGGAPTWPASAVLNASSASNASSNAGTIAVRRMSAVAVAYTVNSTTLATGTVVREYVGQNGSVFAIAWQGPRMPQLGTLLGTYFPSYVQSLDENRSAQGSGISSAVVQRTDLVVQSGGHMGNFSGRAWLPAALPNGVTTDDIQ